MSKSYLTIHEFQTVSEDTNSVQVSSLGVSTTLGNSQSGDVLILSSTGGSSVMLPSPSSGLSYKFIIGATGEHTITAPSALIVGALNTAVFNTGANLSTGAAKTTIATTSGSTVGDCFNLTSDGASFFLGGTVSQYNGVKFV